MFLDNKEEFQTVWQLAHNWVGADPDTTDINAVPPELKDAIHRLMLAISNKRITARTRRWIILEDDSIFTSPLDFYHRLRFFPCLKRNRFNKPYLDNLYVERSDVINWCANILHLDPPPCWSPMNLSSKQVIVEKTNDIKPNTVSDVDTSQQREAAHKRHEPGARVKQDCINYWLQHQNYSNNQAASKFYEKLPEDKRKALKPTNAKRTLAKAISEYRNREKLKEEGKLPHWLINFNPEDPQP